MGQPQLAHPITNSLSWVLSYLHIWLLWDHSWGRWGGGPPPTTQQSPGSSPCLSSCGKPGPQKCFMFFYSYFVLICKIANSGPCPVECGWSRMYIIKYFCHNAGAFGLLLPSLMGWLGAGQAAEPPHPGTPPGCTHNSQAVVQQMFYLAVNHTAKGRCPPPCCAAAGTRSLTSWVGGICPVLLCSRS